MPSAGSRIINAQTSNILINKQPEYHKTDTEHTVANTDVLQDQSN